MTRTNFLFRILLLSHGVAAMMPAGEARADPKERPWRQRVFLQWVEGKSFDAALVQRGLKIMESCAPQSDFPGRCERLVGPIAVLRALEAVKEGHVKPEVLLTAKAGHAAIVQWKVAATKAQRSAEPWESKIRGTKLESLSFHRLIGNVEHGSGRKQMESQACIPAVSQLAWSEWDPHYAAVAFQDAQLFNDEQRELLLQAGGKLDKNSNGGKAVQPGVGFDVLARLGKMYGVPYEDFGASGVTTEALVQALDLGFDIPFSIFHTNGNSHELLAIAIDDPWTKPQIKIADPGFGSAYWIALDDFLTQRLFRMGYPDSQFDTLVLPKLNRTDLALEKRIPQACLNAVDKAALPYKRVVRHPMGFVFSLDGGTGCARQFHWGLVVAQTGKPAVVVHSGIHLEYARRGSLNSSLGLPQSNEQKDSSGQTFTQFENGRIYWTAKRGIWTTLNKSN